MTTLTQTKGTKFQHCIPPKGLPSLLNMHLRAETHTFLIAFRYGASKYLSVYVSCPCEQSESTMKLKQVSAVDCFHMSRQTTMNFKTSLFCFIDR